MKTSASANLLFDGVAPAEVVARVAGAGFDAIEFQAIDPALARTYAPLLDRAGLAVALVNMPVGDFVAGGPGLSAIPGRADDFAASLEEIREVARLLRPGIVHLGPSRIPVRSDRASCLRRLADNARRAIDELAPLGSRVSVEVLNAGEFPGLALESCERALAFIAAVNDDRLVLQYDLYHAAADGRDLPGDIRAMLPHIGHVQFADHPGRGEPGTGGFDLKPCFDVLREGGYSGHIGAEYRPSRVTEETFGWMRWL